MKFNRYTNLMLAYALEDCHAALKAGEGVHSPAYVAKLWAEIDEIRAVQLSRPRVLPNSFRTLSEDD